LIRLGNKLLLVSLSSATVETLAEITDADEVDRLAGLCKQHMPRSSTASFRNVLHGFAGAPTTPGFVDVDRRAARRTPRQTTPAGGASHG
jgi:hypothetical protein